MPWSRRVFMGASLAFTASAAAVWASPQAPPPRQFPVPFPWPETPDNRRDQKRTRAMLKANREAITKDVSRMSELVDSLQKQLKETDTTEILSLDLIRKSEEIAKLAKQVRDLVRG
jgi:hypothetical protein